MKKNTRAAAISIPLLVTMVVVTSSWVSIGEDVSAQESSSQVQTPASKGSIVIRTVQEKDFPALAKVSVPAAMQTALKQVPGGDVLKAGFEEKNGFLVHEVEVVAPDKSIVEFTIDAGTGVILTQSVDQPDDDKHGEHEDDDEDED